MSETSGDNIFLRNARVVLPGHVLPAGSVSIKQGRIASISSDELRVPKKVEEIDLRGFALFPGFIDVHIHGAVGVDTMAATAADLDRVSQFLATQGVTGWLPTLVPAPAADYSRAIKAIEDAINSDHGARILGVHYEGPFVNSTQCGALRARFFRSFSGVADLDDLHLIRNQVAKHMITLAPEIDGGVALVEELHRRYWIISIGHTRAGFDVLDEACEAGARHMTHFMNAMAPLHHRAPGPVAWGLARDNVTCDVIADGVHLDPQMLRLLLKLKGADRLSLISDAVAAAGMGDGNYEIWGETITVNEGRTSNAAGHIAGSVITMLDALRMMKSLDVSEVDVAKMASANPARLLGIDRDCGSIEEGKRADLVALNQKNEVVLTMIGGAIAFDDREKQ
jgi:N-acetylglucosamine-6-phosphate deacetylase